MPRLALSGFQGGGIGGGGSSGSLTGLTRSARRAASLERSSDAPSPKPLPAMFPASPSVRCSAEIWQATLPCASPEMSPTVAPGFGSCIPLCVRPTPVCLKHAPSTTSLPIWQVFLHGASVARIGWNACLQPGALVAQHVRRQRHHGAGVAGGGRRRVAGGGGLGGAGQPEARVAPAQCRLRRVAVVHGRCWLLPCPGVSAGISCDCLHASWLAYTTLRSRRDQHSVGRTINTWPACRGHQPEDITRQTSVAAGHLHGAHRNLQLGPVHRR